MGLLLPRLQTLLPVGAASNIFSKLPLWCALLTAAFFASRAHAESQDFDNYTIHYIAVATTFLTPEIAAEYNIVRSNRRAFLNIAVIRNNQDGSTTPVPATVTGNKRNLLRQSADIEFAEIREGEAIYYIGQFDFSNAENIRLAVNVQPEGKGPMREIEWNTQLYSD
jgi:Domain of unknown function (DUF4426)